MCIGEGEKGSFNHWCSPVVFETDLVTFLKTPKLQQEIFGSCAIIVKCVNTDEIAQVVGNLKGNLTASVHASERDNSLVAELVPKLAHKVGRLIYNQMSTGVEVCSAMNHGGPFPASTNIQSTSVGTEAIKRFQRPICYQNMPKDFLPFMLQRC
jgi:NADP-dependent aldehyde dehydrogenase